MLTDREIVLCIAALEHAGKDLIEGKLAAERLHVPLEGCAIMGDTAAQMFALREKLMKFPTTPEEKHRA